MNNICYQTFIVRRHWTSMEMEKLIKIKNKAHHRHHHHYYFL